MVLNNATNAFTLVSINDYKERIAYDANGNIQKYLRSGDAVRLNMDSLSYTYKPNTNQLDKVRDAAPDAAAGQYDKYNDIRKEQQTGNYQYDSIGNLISDVSEGITNIEWTVYGKISSITKKDDTKIYYTYDAAGNRISKSVSGKETFYVRDAGGNVMSIYSKDASVNNGNLSQTELHLYGSSRLGVYNLKNNVEHADLNTGRIITFTKGNKFFELSNHLGNVLATVSDKKIGVDANADGVIDYFTADLVSAQDYYPFGMLMPSRKYSIANTNYRYGFNGKENDNEVKGEGNQQDYGLRIYDSRLGRFLSVDPLTASYPWYSPYQFAGNNPIKFIDLDGGEPKDPGKYNGEGAIAPQVADGNSCEGTDSYRWTWSNEKWNYATFNVTNSELTSIFDKGKSESLKQIEGSVNLTGATFGITSKKSLAHFLSQAGNEVGGFSKGFDIEENLNYSVGGLIGTFGKYFYNGTAVAGKLDANLYGRITVKGKVTQTANQKAIGNRVYASRMGNGDFGSGDGYKYRGRGMFQLTGKSNYTVFNTFLNEAGVDIVAKPQLILTTEYAIKSAMWFYKTVVVDKLKIESATVKEVTKKVNGGENGLNDRETIYNKAIENLK